MRKQLAEHLAARCDEADGRLEAREDDRARQKQAAGRYRARNTRGQVNIELAPSDRDRWRAYAQSQGLSLTAMARLCVARCMALDGFAQPGPAGAASTGPARAASAPAAAPAPAQTASAITPAPAAPAARPSRTPRGIEGMEGMD